MEKKLEALMLRLMQAQNDLLVEAAEAGGIPAQSTLDRVASMELTIAALQNLLEDGSD